MGFKATSTRISFSPNSYGRNFNLLWRVVSKRCGFDEQINWYHADGGPIRAKKKVVSWFVVDCGASAVRQAVQKAGRRAGDRHSDRLIFLYLMSYKQERGTLFTFFLSSFCFIVAITNMLYCFSYQGPSLVLKTQGLFDTISLRLFLQFAWEPVYEYLCIIVTGKMYLRLVEFLWNLLYWVLSSWLISCRK